MSFSSQIKSTLLNASRSPGKATAATAPTLQDITQQPVILNNGKKGGHNRANNFQNHYSKIASSSSSSALTHQKYFLNFLDLIKPIKQCLDEAANKNNFGAFQILWVIYGQLFEHLPCSCQHFFLNSAEIFLKKIKEHIENKCKIPN